MTTTEQKTKHERHPIEGEEGFGLYQFLIEQDEDRQSTIVDIKTITEVLRVSGSLNAVNAFNRIVEKLP